MYLIFKYGISALTIVLVTEFAKKSDRMGAVIAALPLVTVLSLIWLYIEKQPEEKIANHAYYTFWYVLPTLPMFLLFPVLLSKFGFWITILFSILITMLSFIIVALIVRFFGINLL